MAGNALGRAGDGSTIGEGGLAIRIDAADQGVRPDVNFQATPGVRWVATPDGSGPNRMDVRAELDAEVQLAPPQTGLDLTTGTVLSTLLTSPAFQLGHVTRIVLIADAIVGADTQPTVRVGTDVSVPDNIAGTLAGGAGSQALALAATGDIQELVLRPVRPGVDPGPSVLDEVILDQTAAPGAGFTTYTVTAQLWGVVLTP